MSRWNIAAIALLLSLSSQRAAAADNTSMPTDGSPFGISFQNSTLKAAEMPKALDRGQKSQAAAAAARGASAMQQVQCMRLMNEARKQEDETDKFLMMAMANQQCAQAAESQKAADKNDQSAKQLGQTELPKGAEFTPGKMEYTSDPNLSQNSQPMDLLKQVSNSSGSSDSDKKPINFNVQGVTYPSKTDDKDQPLAKADGEPETDKGIAGPVKAPKSMLDPVKSDRIGFNDSNNNGNPASASNAPNFGAFGNMRTLAQNNDKTSDRSPDSIPSPADEEGRKERGRGEDLYGAAGGGSFESNKGGAAAGDDPFDAMLAQLMGGGQGGEAAPGSDVLIFGGDGESAAKGDRLPNLFEFASFMYARLTFEEGRVRPGSGSTTPPGVSTLPRGPGSPR